jgi:hypothetical protein
MTPIMQKSKVDELFPILNAFAVTLGLMAALFVLLYWLMQPKVFENPGMLAYRAPAGTRLEPLPRVSDAPRLAELPAEQAVAALAQEPTPEAQKPKKGEARKHAKKQSPVRVRREYQEPPNRFAQQREHWESRNRFAQQSDFGFGWQRFGTW